MVMRFGRQGWNSPRTFAPHLFAPLADRSFGVAKVSGPLTDTLTGSYHVDRLSPEPRSLGVGCVYHVWNYLIVLNYLTIISLKSVSKLLRYFDMVDNIIY